MTNLLSFLQTIDSFVWGPPLLILLVGTGVYFTFRLGLLQFRHLPTALKMVFSRDKSSDQQGDVSSFAALCTALSATIGTGNIVASQLPLNWVVQVRSSGCGWPRCLVWQPNTPNVCWR